MAEKDGKQEGNVGSWHLDFFTVSWGDFYFKLVHQVSSVLFSFLLRRETTIQSEIKCLQLRWLVDKFYLLQVWVGMRCVWWQQRNVLHWVNVLWNCSRNENQNGFYYEESFLWKCLLNYSQASINVGVEIMYGK